MIHDSSIIFTVDQNSIGTPKMRKSFSIFTILLQFWCSLLLINSALFLRNFRNFRSLEMAFPGFEIVFSFQMQENPFQDRGNNAKIMRKVPFQNKEI